MSTSLACFFFFKEPAPPEIYALPLPAPLPSSAAGDLRRRDIACRVRFAADDRRTLVLDGLRPGHPEAAEVGRSEEHTSELQSRSDLVCRLLLEKKRNSRGTRSPCSR